MYTAGWRLELPVSLHYTVVFEKKVWLYLQKFYYVIVCVAWMILNGIKTIEKRQYDPKST